MALSEQELIRAHDIAHQIALGEMVRLLIGEIAFDPNPEVFRNRLKALDATLVTSLGSRRLWASANDETEAAIKEAACGYITRTITSIRHPSDATSS